MRKWTIGLGLVAALTAGTNVERMVQQCRRFRPELAVMATEQAARELAGLLDGPCVLAALEKGEIICSF